MGRIGTCLIAFGLLTAACSGQTLDRAETSAAIGTALAAGIEDSLALASAEDLTGAPEVVLSEAVDQALRALPLPDGVSRVVPGAHQSTMAEEGYASFSMPLVIVPANGDEPLFCMVFAASSEGDVVARPVEGDALNRCGDVARINL